MLAIESLSVTYNGHDILQDISLDIKTGELVALVGPNGAGKSTLVRAISGVLHPRRGKISIDGLDLARLSALQRARYLAVVPQARELPPAYTVYQTVLLGRTPYLNWLGQAGKEDHAQVRRALQNTQIQHLAGRRVGQLSGGEQQRVLLARALAQSTPLLLMDEPTTHLDLEHQASLLSFVRNLTQAHRLAVLVVLHDLNLAGLYADRVALLEAGRLQAVGTPAEVLTAPHLEAVFHVPVKVIPHPDSGTPLILPDGRVNLSGVA